MKIYLIVFIALVTFILCSNILGQDVTVSNSNSPGSMWHNSSDSILTGNTYVFDIRLTAGGTTYKSITNGIRIYSPNGAVWTTTVGDSVGTLGGEEFDLLFSIINLTPNGVGADTIIFTGKSLYESGLSSTFNMVAYRITIGPVPTGIENHGKTICIDSASVESSGNWRWSGPEITPSWNGPFCYTIVDEATDIELDNYDKPETYILKQNYPNPFNPITTIKYRLPKNSDVKLSIRNISGQIVAEFNAINKSVGIHSFRWDATDLASGVYFYKLTAGDFTDRKKMLLLK